MNNKKLIECFYDSVNISEHILKSETENAINSNKVYKENFVARKKNVKQVYKDIFNYLSVESNTSFNAAKKYLQYGKTAVLNFANPHYPGGGVHNGAMAQEECLCRSSNLYLCISNKNVFNDYYLYHKDMNHYFFSDRLIYTKGVTVFKDDSDAPQIMPKNEWFNVDVITCAAPYIANRKYTNKTALKELFKGRIKNIFEAAIDNDAEVIILGAFGCGAFKNSPEVVAKAFHEVIEENNYGSYFKKIVFAIKSSVNDDPYEPCPNIMAFEQEFFEISAEANKLRFSDPYPFEQAFGEIKMPSGRILKGGNQFNPYLEWKWKNKYYGKQFSILGDSISTLAGYNPKDYKVFYADENCEKSAVKEMQDTWWGKVIDFFGGELLVNNSWSGSRVTRLPNNENLFPSGCSDERTGKLHINNVKPDVVIVYLGTNDWAFGTEPDGTRLLSDELNMQYFAVAYETMLEKIKTNYLNAEIWCCTLNTSFMSANPSFKFPYKYGGTHIEKYNQIIKDTADMNNCKIIDLYSYHIPYDSIDGSHPNADGMNTLATLMIREIGGKEVKQFMDIENEKAENSFCLYCRKAIKSESNFCPYCGKSLNGNPEFDICPNCNQRTLKHTLSSDYCTNCGFEALIYNDKSPYIWNPLMSIDDIKIGTVLDNKYELLKEIGRGGLSTVYLARDTRINKAWAVKIVKTEINNKVNPIRDSIIQEAKMMKSFNHSAIPNVVDIIAQQNYVAIVMDYVEGETLESIVKEYGAQPVEKVVDWAKQICDVLSYLHTLNPPHIYRDMKPSNVILQPNGSIKIVDFELMRTYKPNQLEDTCNLGTLGYAAPDHFGGNGQTDPRSDIYTIGVTMHRLLTAFDPTKPPHEILPIRAINSDLPGSLEYIISKCTELDRNKRYQTCVELLNDLNRYDDLSGYKAPTLKNKLQNIFKKK